MLHSGRDPFWLSACLPALLLFHFGAQATLGFDPELGRLREGFAASSYLSLVLGFALWLISGRIMGLQSRPLPAPSMPNSGKGRWALALSLAMLAAALASVSYGAWASEALEWDGFVGWELRAKTLSPVLAPSSELALAPPVPVDPAVFLPSMQYPLLLPALGAELRHGFGPGGERFASILILVLWIGLFAAVAHSLRLGRLRGSLLVLAFGLTPMLYSTGSGGADSGYAEILLGYVLTLCSAGLLLRFWPLLFLGSALLIWSKPEGLAYALLLLLVTAFTSKGRGLHYAASLGLAIGLALWLPLRAQLSFAATPSWWLALALPLAAIGAKEAMLRWPLLRRRWRMLSLLSLLAAFALTFSCQELFRESSSLLLRDFLGHPERLFERFALLPEILLGVLQAFLEFKKYGLVFVLLLVLWLLPKLRRWRPRLPSPLAFVLVGLVLCSLTLVFGPEADIEHELESRFDRLLLHWVGPCWLALAPWLARAWAGVAAPGLASPAASSDPAPGSR
ncbi:MAG: hypothetical protein CSA62_05540 [Planctomycetota bacterium]|nr:MAG: hypothetical protein CSA62_05540 [Planctomycetota bacterium]